MFEDFKIISLSVGLPSVSITANGVTFSKSAIVKLGKPAWVVLLMSEDTRQLAIKVCDKADEGATAFLRNRNAKNMMVRWNNRDLLQTIEKMMKWNLDDQGYKIMGEYFSSENALLFDMNKATVIKDREGHQDD